MTTTRTSRSTTRTTATGLATAFLLLLSACGGSAGTEAATEVETDQAPTETTVAETADDSNESNAPKQSTTVVAQDADDSAAAPTGSDDDRDASNQGNVGADNDCSDQNFPDANASYVVGNIPANDPDGGLVVRLIAGPDGPFSTVLLVGTTVTPGFDLNDTVCVEIGSSIWWHLSPSPQLAVGGWINAAFAVEPGQQSDNGGVVAPEDTGEDDFDVELAQIECIYNGLAEACDLLTTFVAGADTNYGLGNSYSMAPSEFLAEDCLVSFDQIACAEIATRDSGGDVSLIAATFVAAYQAGDVAGQQSMSGSRQVEFNNGGVIENTDPTVTTGVDSVSVFGNEFSWQLAPTINGRCIVTDGLVQGCTVTGD